MRSICAAILVCLMTAAAASDPLARSDEKFLNDFAQANAAQVVAGKFAAENAQDSDVKAFGRVIADDYSKALSRIAEFARAREIEVKAKPGVADKGKELLLERRGAAKFDEAYVSSQVDAAEEAIGRIQAVINEGQDASVKQLAARSLPEVRHHLEMAKRLQGRLAVLAVLQ